MIRLLLLCLLALPGQAQSAVTVKQVAQAEARVQKHDQALARLANGLEDWLAGRADLAAMKATVAAVKSQLSQPLSLPSEVSTRVTQAEQGLLSAVNGFTTARAPDAEGQRALFEQLNVFTRDRSLALLHWRVRNNEQLRKQHKPGTQGSRYLEWEAAWLPLWKSEVDLSYRLQKSALSQKEGQSAGFVRELLSLQSQAAAVNTPQELQALQEISLRRLTVLARTAEQLGRLQRGESRGAVSRVRRLSKELAELGQQLQERRLGFLNTMAK